MSKMALLIDKQTPANVVDATMMIGQIFNAEAIEIEVAGGGSFNEALDNYKIKLALQGGEQFTLPLGTTGGETHAERLGRIFDAIYTALKMDKSEAAPGDRLTEENLIYLTRCVANGAGANRSSVKSLNDGRYSVEFSFPSGDICTIDIPDDVASMLPASIAVYAEHCKSNKRAKKHVEAGAAEAEAERR